MSEVSLGYTVHSFTRDSRKLEFTRPYRVLNIVMDNDLTVPIVLFSDFAIRYEFIELTVHIQSPDVPPFGVIGVEFQSGAVEHTWAQIYFRLAFAVFDLTAAVMLWYRLRWSFKCRWALEQRATELILVLAVVANDPIYFVQVIRPVAILWYVETLAACLLHAAMCAFVVFNLDSLRRSRFLARLPRLELPFLVFFVMSFPKFLLSLHKRHRVLSDSADRARLFLVILVVLVNCSYVLGVVWLLFVAVTRFDLNLLLKYALYATSAFWIGIETSIAETAGELGMVFRGSEYCWVLWFMTSNIFVLMMAFLHWPCEGGERSKSWMALQRIGEGDNTVIELCDVESDQGV
jgi:hypothetical protein